MSATAAAILESLHAVDGERTQRAAEPGLGAKATALKAFQQRRFSHTYADLLASSRYGPAARFFLDELYGPRDFTLRDAQFARVVPALVRLFPHEIVETVMHLARLHALSETLDTAMARCLADARVEPDDYVQAWQQVGRARERRVQIELTLDVADRLDRLTRKPLLRPTLHLMRAPARAAGLGELQLFLETGFDTFRAMHGAQEFLAIVELREEALAAALFGADARNSTDDPSRRGALAVLPA